MPVFSKTASLDECKIIAASDMEINVKIDKILLKLKAAGLAWIEDTIDPWLIVFRKTTEVAEC